MEKIVGQVWYVDVLSARHVPVVLVIRVQQRSVGTIAASKTFHEMVSMRQAHNVEKVGQAPS